MRFWDTLEAAARSWESAVDMVAARMPDRMMPATIAGRMPCLLMRSAILTMILWLSVLTVMVSRVPFWVMA